MSDGIKRWHEDEEAYESLCRRYNQQYVDCYGLHATMISALDKDCHHFLPPALWPERIKRFEKEYAEACEKKNQEANRRKKRFAELMKTLSPDDISILKEYREEMWRY